MYAIDDSELEGDFEIDGKNHHWSDESTMLAILLAEDVCFVNEREYSFRGKKEGRTTVVFVNLNDVFFWACADAETLPNDEIPVLYKMHKADPTWGRIIWGCRQRKMKPQRPVIEDMKRDGVWSLEMEALPDGPKDRG